MCGFEVYLQKNNLTQDKIQEVIKASFANKNRGPERSKIIVLDRVVIVFHRLCIMNMSHELDQPFVYQCNNKTYYIICNGEIYNYLELDPHAKNDTSAIFTAYRNYNFDFLELNKKLNGEYALCIIEIDNTTNQVSAKFSTDTCSVRPLFYHFNSDYTELALSSLLGGITELSDVNTSKIRRLNGSEACEFSQNCANFYPTYTTPSEIITDESQAISRINNCLTQAVISRLQTDRPFGCLLSGGLDSSLVAAIASNELKKRGQRLRTFTIGMKHSTDIPFARKVAEHIGSDHTEVEFDQQEALETLEEVIKCCGTYDITTIRASVGQYLIAKWISQNTDIKVVLNGDGSDEAWMGYLYFHLAPTPELAQIDSARLLYNIHHFDGLRVDRCISNWGLEARLPFLDKNMVELSYLITPELKVPHGVEKWILRKSFSDQQLLPDDVLWRKKEAFSDSFSDTKKSWFQIVQEHIQNTKSVNHEKTWSHNAPVSIESRWYREIYEKYYGDSGQIIPYFWLPNWCNTTEPSARTLEIYTALDTDREDIV